MFKSPRYTLSERRLQTNKKPPIKKKEGEENCKIFRAYNFTRTTFLWNIFKMLRRTTYGSNVFWKRKINVDSNLKRKGKNTHRINALNLSTHLNSLYVGTFTYTYIIWKFSKACRSQMLLPLVKYSTTIDANFTLMSSSAMKKNYTYWLNCTAQIL